MERIRGKIQMEHVLTIIEVDSQREFVCIATIRGEDDQERDVSIGIRRVQTP